MTATVNWNDFVRQPRPNGTRIERFYRVTYDCGHDARLRRFDAKRAESGERGCATCAQSKAGRKGYAVTAARHGRGKLIAKIRQHQLENPSSLERTVKAHLIEKHVQFDEQVIIERGGDRHWLVDFILPGKVVVEVDGAWVHQQRAAQDAQKQRWLEAHGYTVVRVPEAQVTAEALPALLEGVLI